MIDSTKPIDDATAFFTAIFLNSEIFQIGIEQFTYCLVSSV